VPEETRPARATVPFRCLRCGREFELQFTPGLVEERTCPHCTSNSVRRVKARPGAGKTEGRQPAADG